VPQPLTEREWRLLRAFGSLALGLELAELLRRIVKAACDLTDAQYGALGVIGADRLLVEFVHEGMDEDAVTHIGHLPEGHGVLGLLIEEPVPIRVPDLAKHPSSYGFPPNHPPMGAFLGAPIRIGNDVFGNIYLTNKRSADEFTKSDEELIIALAATAGSAIANARAHSETARREQTLGALQAISHALLSGGTLPEVLNLVATDARFIIGSATAAIMVLTDDGSELELAAGVGFDETVPLGTRVPAGEASVFGRVVASGESTTFRSPKDSEEPVHAVFTALGDGPSVLVPMWVEGEPFGALAVGRTAGPVFDDMDVHLLESFATQASVALQYRRAQEQLRSVAVFEDEERIARDLHDSVIQQLFAVGMSLQSGLRLIDNPAVMVRQQQAIDDIDTTIRRIRSTIFSLGHARSVGLRSLAVSILNELASAYGLLQNLEVVGAVDAAANPELTDELAATLREAISNVGRHAHASRVEVQLRAENSEFILRVRDNGVGMTAPPERRSGLANMEERARRLGGSMTLSTGAGLGTLIEWRVPTHSSDERSD
jgi:signal transduction histidine kinase